MESLPTAPGEMTLVYRATDLSDLALRHEIDDLAARRGAKVHYLVGSRHDHPEYLSPGHIRQLAPDVAHRDVFVCGPESFTDTVRASLRTLRVSSSQIHTESFEF
jgi:ferredoxin-NADP reductase